MAASHIREIRVYARRYMYSRSGFLYLVITKSCLYKNGILLVNNMSGHNLYDEYLYSSKHKMAKLYRCLHAVC
jgi:hypothetical protein